MMSSVVLTLGCGVLRFLIKAEEEQGAGQVDPDFSRTVRFHGESSVLLSENNMKPEQIRSNNKFRTTSTGKRRFTAAKMINHFDFY